MLNRSREATAANDPFSQLNKAAGNAGANAEAILTATANLTQQTVTVAAGVPAAVVNAGNFSAKSSGLVHITGAINGIAGTGATSATTVAIQQSTNGGGTWANVQVATPSALTAAGVGAATSSTVAFDVIVAAPINPATPTEYRVLASPVGGSFATTVAQGGITLQEAG